MPTEPQNIARSPERGRRSSPRRRISAPPDDEASARHQAPSNEWRRMVAGQLYDPNDPYLVSQRARARRLAGRYNASGPDETASRARILRELLGSLGPDAQIAPPLYCDYGSNVVAGSRLYMNYGCVVLDCARVEIGDRVLIGPHVQIYTARHPTDPQERARGRESASAVVIGDDVWIGGGAILCPGVRVGDGSTIGAGSVVTRNVPPGVVAAGNPCRVLRPALDDDP